MRHYVMKVRERGPDYCYAEMPRVALIFVLLFGETIIETWQVVCMLLASEA